MRWDYIFGLVLYHLKGFMVVLYGDVSSIDKGMDFLRQKQTDTHSLLILAHMISVSVKVLLANAIGCLYCNGVAPRPY